VNNKERNPFDLSSTKFAQRSNTMKKTLTGKVALVTGGSRGIGAAQI
jgi:23S rRNA pseudoU1915 N3-methylase RlmH